MKDHPILFSTAMVRTLLAGTKTQTRRVVKPQPPVGWQFSGFNIDDHALFYPPTTGDDDMAALEKTDPRFRCPYGKPGDLLWVRETWANGVYKADVEVPTKGWKPAIHMRRTASRLTLELTEVRVQWLQDISEDGGNPQRRFEKVLSATQEAMWAAIDADEQTKQPKN